MHHKKLNYFFATAFLCLSVSSSGFAGEPSDSSNSCRAHQGATGPGCDFRSAMRKLWEDHITWTRIFIISAFASLPDQPAATARLLQNQVDIGNAIKPFYGNEAGDKLTALLTDHILTAAEIVTAIKTGDAEAADAATKRWYVNGDEIAAFLSAANPKNWPLAETRAMMRSHLDLTAEEVVARFLQDWDADVAAYDKVHNEILEMADFLAFGILKQFPCGKRNPRGDHLR